MADQHNSNIPALPNQVAEDIPDIKENLEFHKDTFQRILETWSDTDNSSQKIDSATGFNNGTYNFEFPTNGVAAHAVIMTGDSDTIAWLYLNAAPPGWKVTATGADTVLAVSGGAQAYNVNGGNPDSVASWSHPIHKVYDYNAGSAHQGYNSSGAATDITIAQTTNAGIEATTSNTFKLNLDLHTSADNTYRIPGSVGKLFQLDTA